MLDSGGTAEAVPFPDHSEDQFSVLVLGSRFPLLDDGSAGNAHEPRRNLIFQNIPFVALRVLRGLCLQILPKPLGCRQANSTVTAGHYCNFSCESWHVILPPATILFAAVRYFVEYRNI